MPHIFISYAKKDTRALAEALHDALLRVPGVTAWMDRSLEADESWASQIMEEIDACDYFVVLLSPDINRRVTPGQRRSFVLNEIDYVQGLDQHKPILPVMVIKTRMPVQIAGIQYIDLTATPTNPMLIVERVCVRFGLLRSAASIPDSVSVSACEPSDADQVKARRLLDSGWDKYFKGDDVGAKADLDAAFALSRGGAKQVLSDDPAAQSDFNNAVHPDPKSARSLRSEGVVKILMHDYAGAIADLDESLRPEPGNADALRSRGEAKRLLGDYIGAIADFDESLRLEPQNVFSLGSRGQSKLALGDYSGAVADLDAAHNLDPGVQWVQTSRDEARAKLGGMTGS